MNYGSIFLFSDVLIIAKCVLAGRRYVAEIAFRLNSSTFSTKTAGAEMVFEEKETAVTTVEFEDNCLAQSWDRYIQFARSRQQFIPTYLKASWKIIHSTVLTKVESKAPVKKKSSFKAKLLKSFQKEKSVSDLIKKFEKEVAGINDIQEMGLEIKMKL